ncbi:MAG: tetraacyldisaccharide 4'-kinase [Chitinispirillales bacterium]|nr:tetraacyldisaccharide 4'-kinase [Chitinispirillales bacterium]
MSTDGKKNSFDSPLPAKLSNGITAKLLSYAYSAVITARNSAYDSLPSLSRRLDFPVISVGGIRAGGTGKTPVTRLIARHLIDNHNINVAILSRGYGRSSKKNVVVKPGEPADWRLTGDEPCMLHNNLPESWLGIGADRTALARMLSPLLPDRSVFLLDDGFQRRQTRRDLDIVCLSEGVFDDRLMPAGYLREPVSALIRADIVLVIGAQERADKLKEVRGRVDEYLSTALKSTKNLPVTAVLLRYPDVWVNARSGETAPRPPMESPAVVTGIARPERFLAELPGFSVIPSGVYKFPDHYNFKRNDIARIHNIYLYGVATTEKDAVRLLSPAFSGVRDLWYLREGLRFADEESGARVLSRAAGVAGMRVAK